MNSSYIYFFQYDWELSVWYSKNILELRVEMWYDDSSIDSIDRLYAGNDYAVRHSTSRRWGSFHWCCLNSAFRLLSALTLPGWFKRVVLSRVVPSMSFFKVSNASSAVEGSQVRRSLQSLPRQTSSRQHLSCFQVFFDQTHISHFSFFYSNILLELPELPASKIAYREFHSLWKNRRL